MWMKRGLCVEDTVDMTAAEKEKYIKRDCIWPKTDIQEELNKGIPRFIVYWHNEMRKTVRPKRITLFQLTNISKVFRKFVLQ